MKRFLLKALPGMLVGISLFFSSQAFANPAAIDPSFNIKIPAGFNGYAGTLAIQANKKIVVGGSFTTYQGISGNRIIRLNGDGTKDTSFNIGNGFDNEVTSIVMQPDGKILVGGLFTTYNGTGAAFMIRLNADGSKDTSFNMGWGFSSQVYNITLQPDGKILVGGNFNTYSGASANRIIRLNSDGTRDSSFTMGGGFNSQVFAIAVQSDGKIIVGGNFTTYSGASANRIIRLNSDGTRDTSFTMGGGFNNTISAIAFQSDAKIIVGGSFTTYSGAGVNRIIRLNTDGTKDDSFAIGAGFNGPVKTLGIKSDGKILVGGGFYTYNGATTNRIIRINTDGTKDTSFNMGAGFDSTNATAYSLAMQDDGQILVGGSFFSYSGTSAKGIVKLNEDGTRNNSLSPGMGFDSSVYSIVTQNDGKVIVGGDFRNYSGTSANRMIRLNPDGTRDASFDIGAGFNNVVWTMSMQADGKIIVGGWFYTYKGASANYIIRLNADGTKDTSFNIGAGFENAVWAMALQPDGKIVVGGGFTTYSGTSANRIIRLNPDGTRDDSFTMGGGFNGEVRTLAIQSDGKIVVGGLFTTYSGTSANRIIRLNPDGTRDDSFAMGGGFNDRVNAIAIQSDGKIMVGGRFITYSGAQAYFLMRLNSDGTKDFSKGMTDGFFGRVNTIAIQADGKIIAGGEFDRKIVRLNSNCSEEASFNIGVGFNDWVNTLFPQADGKIIVGGSFTTHEGMAAGYLTRLYGDSEVVTLPNSTDTGVIIDAFVEKGYTQSDDKLIGSVSISLSDTDGNIPSSLNIESNDIGLSLQADTQITKIDNVTNYSGYIGVPSILSIDSINNESVIYAFKVGSSSESIRLTGGVATLTAPTQDKAVGDSVNIYYSEDNGVSWYFQTGTNVIDIAGQASVSFTTDHFTDFAITVPMSMTGSFVINNDDEATTGTSVTLSISTTPSASKMRFSNDEITRSSREAFLTTKNWTLGSGGGAKTVYAEFDIDGDSVGDIQTNDTIFYDALSTATTAVETTEAAILDLSTQALIDDAQSAYDIAAGLVSALPESTDKDDLNARLLIVQSAITDAQAQTALATATTAVETTEAAILDLSTQALIDDAQSAYNIAAGLVSALPESTDKDDLNARLLIVQSAITDAQAQTALATATTAVETTEAAILDLSTQTLIDDAQSAYNIAAGLVSALPESTDKDDLNARLVIVQTAITDGQTAYDTAQGALSTATTAVETAEAAILDLSTQALINDAQSAYNIAAGLVSALPESADKDDLNARLVIVQTAITDGQTAYDTAQGELSTATTAVETAEAAILDLSTQTLIDDAQSAYNIAAGLVSALPESTDKDDLNARLVIVQTAITDGQTAYDTAQGALANATTAVETAEAAILDLSTQTLIDDAQSAHDIAAGLVSALPESTDKDDLNARLLIVQPAITDAQAQTALATATTAVETTEAAILDLSTQTLIDDAQSAYNIAAGLVSALPESADKDDLNARLVIVQTAITDGQTAYDAAQGALSTATTAVETAEAAILDLSTQALIDDAQSAYNIAAGLVSALPESTDKDDLNARLVIVQTAITDGQTAYDTAQGALANATTAVETAEAAILDLSTQTLIDDAQSAHDIAAGLVSALPESTDKDNLNARLLIVQSAITDAQTAYDSGCIDPLASNYNAEATQDDGSCTYVWGCTNPVAANYNAEATQDDGSCQILGCMNPSAVNYDRTANTDDGSCQILGCINPNATNYNGSATEDDGSCQILGCMNSNATNYNAEANQEDGSCQILGCMDSQADNYNAEANQDDSSCTYIGLELNVDNITQDPFNCATDVTECNLYNLRISHIAPGTFVNHPNLQTIYLYGNLIDDLAPGTFDGLSSLTYLDIDENKITKLSSGMFQGLSNLIELDIYANPITEVETGTFNGLTSLQYLYASNLKLKTLTPGMFEGLGVSLTEVYLGDPGRSSTYPGSIEEVETGTFDQLTGLLYLDLVNTPIHAIPANVFDNLTSLGSYPLGSNCIDPTTVFTNEFVQSYDWQSSQYVCPTISYDPSTSTDGDVAGTISFIGGDEANRTTLNAISDPILSHTWTRNGNWGFDLNSLAESNLIHPSTLVMTGTVGRIIDDTTAPTSTISYDIETTTSTSVIATISLNETGSITNNGGSNTHTFTDNGSFTFEFQDTAGNTGSATATVSWIQKQSSSNGGGGHSSIRDTVKDILKGVSDLITTKPQTVQKVGDISNSPYSRETNAAYLWAYNAGITTTPSVKEANIEGKIYRAHLAKMLSEYAINVLGKQPNTGANCQFSDMKNQSAEMKKYATTACQLGLMGLKSDGTVNPSFNPSDEVTRAQFGTTLSRLLYGNENNSHSAAGDRYEPHLQALKEAGIMTKITNPTADELRGNAFLMLMRAAK